MWNGLTLGYVVVAAAAFALVAAGAISGVRLAADFPEGPDSGDRDRFDRRHALVVSLLRLGIAARLALVPLWFLALSSLVPHVPGGMCLASIHHLGGFDAWAVSILKLALPSLLLIWAALDTEDRSRNDERLLRTKWAWIAPVVVAVAAESTLEWRFFAGLQLGPSPCCMTLFDGAGGAEIVAGPSTFGWVLLAISGAAALVFLSLAAVSARRPVLVIPAAASALVAAVALLWALHHAPGSAWMKMPSHRCIFCVLRLEPTALAAAALAFVGAWLAVSRAAVWAALRRAGAEGRASLKLPGILLIAAAALAAWGLI